MHQSVDQIRGKYLVFTLNWMAGLLSLLEQFNLMDSGRLTSSPITTGVVPFSHHCNVVHPLRDSLHKVNIKYEYYVRTDIIFSQYWLISNIVL